MRATITTALENGAELEDMRKAAGHRDLGATKLHEGRGSIDPRKRAAMQACIDHARALLDSARAVQHTNIAYHPATLTLEETLPLFESETVDNTKVDLKDVAIIKVVCDTLFLQRVDRRS